MPINCNCPVCGSRNTKSLAIIYESGQRFGKSTRNSIWMISGALGLGRSTTRSHWTSLLASNAAPPGKINWSYIGWPLIGVSIFMEWPIWIVPAVILPIALLYGASDIFLNAEDGTVWRNAFRCLRCGTTFEPFNK